MENWYKKRDKLIEECAKIRMDLKKHRGDLTELNEKRMEALKNCDKYPDDWKKYQEEWMKYQEDWEKYQEDLNKRQEELDKQRNKNIQKWNRTGKYYEEKRKKLSEFLAIRYDNNSIRSVYAKQYVKHTVLSCQYMLDNVLLNHFVVRLNPSLESSY